MALSWSWARGAMGVTYRAVDTILHHAVALKVVAPEVAGNPHARARFLREAQAAASLRHPHIASVFFFGERPADRQLFYAMELIEGETLQARVARAGGLPADTVLEIGTQVADALAAAEARGLTHRDLKPANVMLGQGEKRQRQGHRFRLGQRRSSENRTERRGRPHAGEFRRDARLRQSGAFQRLAGHGCALGLLCARGNALVRADRPGSLRRSHAGGSP